MQRWKHNVLAVISVIYYIPSVTANTHDQTNLDTHNIDYDNPSFSNDAPCHHFPQQDGVFGAGPVCMGIVGSVGYEEEYSSTGDLSHQSLYTTFKESSTHDGEFRTPGELWQTDAGTMLPESSSPGVDKASPSNICSNERYPNWYSQLLDLQELDRGVCEAPKRSGAVDISESVQCRTEVGLHAGEMTTPSYPAPDKSKLDCVWEITAPSGLHVRLTFDFIKTALLEDCSAGSVHVQDGPSPLDCKEKSCVQYCNIPRGQEWFSTTNHVVIDFKANNISEVYLLIRYRFVSLAPVVSLAPTPPAPPQCGRVHRESSGSITSPGYPAPYGINLMCEWTIQAPDGQRIEMHFRDVDIEFTDGCTSDRLRLHDGPLPLDCDAYICTDLCSSVTGFNWLSTRGTVVLRLTTDEVVSGHRGFSMSYNFRPEYQEASLKSSVPDI